MISDMLGYYSAADTVDAAIEQTYEAINGHLQILLKVMSR